MIDAASALGINALVNMLISIIMIAVSWWALQAFKFDLFIRDINGTQAKLLQMILSIAIGHSTARFFVDYIQWTQLLRLFF